MLNFLSINTWSKFSLPNKSKRKIPLMSAIDGLQFVSSTSLILPKKYSVKMTRSESPQVWNVPPFFLKVPYIKIIKHTVYGIFENGEQWDF